jgi:hypothetical protein
MASEDDTLKKEIEEFEEAYEAESENRNVALDDLKFARLSEQWPEQIRKQREVDGRPILTINKMPAFIRQVVNDSRQNRPQIKVKPVDDKADIDTANVLEGLIRNIERTSKADVAYDTAVDYAVSMGWGYIRVNIDYEYDDTFDKCLKIERIANPFSVYGDPYSTSMDGSDWNRCWITELKSKEEFKAKWKNADPVDWESLGYDNLKAPWRDSDDILICESWHREETEREIYQLSSGEIVGKQEYEAGRDIFEMAGIVPVNNRTTKAYKITQRIMTGAEILEENEWLGRYLPIIPVYGEELNVEGKRYFRSLIHNAKDAQRMFNYWRTTITELVALAPRVPYIGEEGSFDADPNWLTANSQNHAFLQYARGTNPPQRQPLDGGGAAGAMSEALAASDDMKSIIGMYDASLGQRSNETSGRAIMARQREGDVNTFHFIDNLARSIRHVGCVLIDLIPKVYSGQRIVRIIGQDDSEEVAKIGQQEEQGEMPEQEGMIEGAERIYDLGLGRYDVAVDTGPSFTTRREEQAQQMIELIRGYPQAAPLIGDLLVKSLDWQNAEEISERLKAMLPQQINDGIPAEVQQQIQEGQQRLQQLEQENQQLKGKAQGDMMKGQIDQQKLEIDRQKMQIEAYKAETERMQAEQAMAAPLPPVANPVSPVSISMPEQVGGALAQNLAQTVAPIIAQSVAQAMQQTMATLPPLQVNQPRMKRTPVRDPQTGLIMHTIDEPVMDEAQDPNQIPMVN